MTRSAPARAQRTVVGDVLEITTPKGLAYAQVSHEHPMYGDLIRVLPGLYSNKPDLGRLVQQPHAWVTFFPARAAVARGILRKAGNFPVPGSAAGFPVFRIGGLPDPSTHAISRWSHWDGGASRPIKVMHEQDWALPPLETINDTMLIDRIVSGWRPEHDRALESRLHERQGAALPGRGSGSPARHFLFFPKEHDARSAAKRIALMPGLRAEVRESDDRGDWSVIVEASGTPPADTRERLKEEAQRFSGTYDGWELPVSRSSKLRKPLN